MEFNSLTFEEIFKQFKQIYCVAEDVAGVAESAAWGMLEFM